MRKYWGVIVLVSVFCAGCNSVFNFGSVPTSKPSPATSESSGDKVTTKKPLTPKQPLTKNPNTSPSKIRVVPPGTGSSASGKVQASAQPATSAQDQGTVHAAQPATQETRHVAVTGNNSQWTKISGVEAKTLIRVSAIGKVDFGGIGSTWDDANAGVTGSTVGRWAESIFGGGGLAMILSGDPALFTAKVNKDIMKAFQSQGDVNYDQGGVWIKIVSRSTGKAENTNLYYYWDQIYNKVGFMSDSDVDVYAKAHDGGRQPGNTGGYGDNKGSYEVWLRLEKPARVAWTLP